MTIKVSSIKEGAIVLIAALDDIPQHQFLIQSVEEDCVTGIATTGPLEGSYGEPPFDLIIAVIEP